MVSKTDTVIDGIKTSMYVSILKKLNKYNMYSLYANPENSLGDIVKYTSIESHSAAEVKVVCGVRRRISDMLRNPVYEKKADADVCDFFKVKGKCYQPCVRFYWLQCLLSL